MFAFPNCKKIMIDRHQYIHIHIHTMQRIIVPPAPPKSMLHVYLDVCRYSLDMHIYLFTQTGCF